VRCFAPSQLIFIRIDKMFLHFSIKFTHKYEKLLGIATEFFLDLLEASTKILSKLLDFTTLLKYLVRRKDVTRIDK
jgi:hypothetical protein